MSSVSKNTASGETARQQFLSTLDMVYIGIFAILISICSWITIPLQIPFTLQTFGVFMAVEVLGGRRGSLAVLVYLLLGVIGLPVFSGFQAGLGILAGTTGGYLVGFLVSALVMWLFQKLLGRKPAARIVTMLIGLLICYAFGTAWFMLLYARANGSVALLTVLGWCVFPFILPDLVKIAAVYFLSPRFSRFIR